MLQKKKEKKRKDNIHNTIRNIYEKMERNKRAMQDNTELHGKHRLLRDLIN